MTKGDILQGAGFMLAMLYALLVDGLMDKLGDVGFMIVSLVVLGVIGALVEAGK